MKIYCLKCKKQTETKNVAPGSTKNKKRFMIKGVCSKCGTKKNQFISKPRAKQLHDGGALDFSKGLGLAMPQLFGEAGISTPLLAGLNLL